MSIASDPTGTVAVSSPAPLGPSPVDFSATINADTTVLMEVDSYPTSGTVTSYAGIAVDQVGGTPVSGSAGISSFNFDQATQRFSDRNFVSKATDTGGLSPILGVQLWKSRLQQMDVTRQVSLSPESYAAGDQSGQATLENNDGAMDGVLDGRAVDGRRFRVLVGPSGAFKSYDTDFVCVFDGCADQWFHDTASTARVAYADNSYLLDVPLQTNRYGGTGTYDGNATVKGVLIPLCYGDVFNVSPQLIDPSYLIYQAHGGPIHDIPALRDRANALTFQGYTTNLYSGSTASGYYRVDVSRGLVQLGATPTGQVTCDVQGDADTAYGGYVNTLGAILLRALRKNTEFGNDTIQESSFSNLDIDLPGVAGCYITGDTTARQFMDDRLRNVGGYWFFLRDRRLRVQVLKEPVANEVIMTLTVREIIDAVEMQMPASMYPPTHTRRVGFHRNYTVQSSDIAGAVTAAQQQQYALEWPIATSTDADVLVRFLRARDPNPLQSDLRDLADATAVAVRLQNLHGQQRQLLNVTIQSSGAAGVAGNVGLSVEMGMSVKIVYPRFGLSNGKLFRAFPVSEDYLKRTITLACWG